MLDELFELGDVLLNDELELELELDNKLYNELELELELLELELIELVLELELLELELFELVLELEVEEPELDDCSSSLRANIYTEYVTSPPLAFSVILYLEPGIILKPPEAGFALNKHP